MNTVNRDLFTRLNRTRPLLMAAVLCLIGCMVAYALRLNGVIWCAIIAVMLILAFLLRKCHRNIAIALLLIAFLPLGALRFDCAWNALTPLPEQKNVELCGRICQTPVWNAEKERTICVLESFTIDKAAQRGKLRLYLRGDTELLQQIQLGQTVRCKAHIWVAERATNPGEFNFSNYLRCNGLRGYATAEIEGAELSEPSLRLSDWRERTSGAISRRIESLFPKNAALAQALLLGDRSGLSEEERKSYSISGAAHLLAISGMHVSILAGFLSILLSRLTGRRTAFGITLICLLAYGALIGYSASLLRAILMYAISSAAPLAGRYSDAPTRLGAALLIYLLMRPLAIWESGFILSYGASAGIILLYSPLERLFHAGTYLRKQTGVGIISLFTGRLPRWILQSILYTLSAQLAILPAVVYFFGSQPLWSFVVNLIAIPLTMAAYIVSIPALICGLSSVALLSDSLFSLLTGCVRFFSALPFASIGIARFPVWLTLICIVACLCTSDLCALPEKLRRYLLLTVLLAVFVSNGCSYLSTGGCSVVFLDAGEADCAVIRSGHSVYLVDTGDAYTPAGDYLSAMNYDLEGVFLSHPHTDHAGGLERILEVCTPRRIYISENWEHYEIDENIAVSLERARAQGTQIIRLSAGDSLALSDKTLLEVLSPTAGFPANSANDDSLVLRLTYGECSAIFSGDAPAKVTAGRVGDADILKVGHHGGADSLSAALLTELSPSVAVLPVGYNTYGHPAEQTLKLLDAAQTQVFRTDLHGAVTCRLNVNGCIDVRPYQTAEADDGLE